MCPYFFILLASDAVYLNINRTSIVEFLAALWLVYTSTPGHGAFVPRSHVTFTVLVVVCASIDIIERRYIITYIYVYVSYQVWPLSPHPCLDDEGSTVAFVWHIISQKH